MSTPPKRKVKRRKKNRLDAMPKLVMEEILQYCNYFSINALRKTCRRIRHLVDIIKPDPGVKELKCSWVPSRTYISSDIIKLELAFWNWPSREMSYKDRNFGCLVSQEGLRMYRPKKFFEYTRAAQMFRQDLKILLPMLAHQKTPLAYCKLILDEPGVLEDSMGEIARQLNAQIPTVSLKLSCHEPSGLAPMLSMIRPKTLIRLTIKNLSAQKELVDLGAVSELDQWKNLKQFKLCGYYLDTPTSLCHIPYILLSCYRTTPVETIVALREVFRHSSTFEHCRIFAHEQKNRDEVKRALSLTDAEDNILYFSTPTPEYVLKVDFHRNIVFNRIPTGELTGFDIIQD